MPDALVRISLQADDATAGADRFAQALHRVERAEPTRALRQTRMAVDELASAATGLHPALGRLASTLTMFGIGGAVGIAAVGGIAAIGLEVKSLLNIVPALETSFKKLNTEFAAMGGPGSVAMARIAGIQERITALADPSLMDRAMGVLRFLGGGKAGEGALGQFEGVRQIEGATESATLRNELMRAHSEALKIHTDALKKHAAELEKGAAERMNLANRMRPEHLLTMGGPGSFEAAFTGAHAAHPLQGPLGLRAEGFAERAALGGLGAHPMEAHLTEGEKTRLRLGEDPGADRRRNIELGVGAALSVVSGVAQGGAGGAIGGLGSAATALSGLKGISAGAANVLGPVGIGLSAISSLVGLFGHHEPAHVIIDGYDSKALSQQQQLMLALTGFKGLNIELLSAGRGLGARLGREARTDGNMRVPPGGGF